jgi:mannobiose 2-epimerase
MTTNTNRITELKPILLQNLEQNILKFWVTKTIDTENGGFFGLVNDKNKAVNSSKGVVLNTRILWTFSAACEYFNSPEYKKLADRAYNYISEFFLDKKYGGVYWELDFKGNPLNRRKQVYAQTFAIYSFVEYFKITKKNDVLDQAVTIYRLIEKHSLDTIKGGYIDAFREDWSEIHDMRLSEKDMNAPKTMNTHIHILEAYTSLYRVWKDEGLRISLRNLILLFLEKFLDERGHLILFFDNDWNRLADYCSYGHDIEFSWLLTEAASVLGDSDLIARTRKTAVEIATIIVKEGIALDGGLMNEFDYGNNELDADKHWWQQAEAMVGFFNAYQISSNEKFLFSMLQVWDFIDKFIIDHKNSEWFWKVDKNGKVYPGMEKAGLWKCPYHNSRAIIELLGRIKETRS